MWQFFFKNNLFLKSHYFFVLFVLLVFLLSINELTLFPLVKCCHSLSQFNWSYFSYFLFCHKTDVFVTFRRMIIKIMSFRKSLIINTLNGIIWFYDNKDKQDKQNMSYWKEIIILCYSFRSLGIFPNRVGSEAVINSQPNFLTNGLVTTDSKIIVMVV